MQEWVTKYFTAEYLKKYKEKQNIEQTRQEVDFIVKALDIKRGEQVLDVPCGFGRHTNELLNRGFNAYGVDITPLFIEAAQKQSKKREYNFFVQDMRFLQFNYSKFGLCFAKAFNFFTSFGYYSDIDNEKCIKNIVSILKSGGKFLMHVRNREWLIQHFVKNQWTQYADRTELIERDFNFKTSRMNTNLTFCYDGKTDVVQQSIRFYTLAEIVSMFKRNNLNVCSVYGGIEFEDYTKDSEWMIVVGEKR